MSISVINADCLAHLATLPDATFTAIVTDPPYGLEFMGKGWDKVLPPTDVWREALRVLKPGGHALVFGGTRTYHRLACALEDAGFEIRDCLTWIQGQGFPKSKNLSGLWKGYGTALKPAHEVILCAEKPGIDWTGLLQELDLLESRLSNDVRLSDPMAMSQSGETVNTCLSTVRSWKRTLEDASKRESMFTTAKGTGPIIDWRTLRFCLSRITLENMLQYATRLPGSTCPVPNAVWFSAAAIVNIESTLTLSALGPVIDGALTELQDGLDRGFSTSREPIILARKPLVGTVERNCHEHGTGALNIDGCRIETLESLSGGAYGTGRSSVSSSLSPTGMNRLGASAGQYVQPTGRWPANLILDEAAAKQLDAQAPDKGQAAPLKKRNSDKMGRNAYGEMRGAEDADFAPHDERGGASRFFYCSKASKKDRGGAFNNHATVKPVGLMRWLVRLVKGPGENLVLDPFAGSGTTGVACQLEGVPAVLVEREAAYAEIIRGRLAP